MDPSGRSNPGRLITFCLGLVVIEPESESVRLVHTTLSEYLESQQRAIFSNFGSDITSTCLTYLLFQDLHDKIENIAPLPSPPWKHALSTYPFYGYASMSWIQHLLESGMNKHRSLTMEFFVNEACLWNALQFEAASYHSKLPGQMLATFLSAVTYTKPWLLEDAVSLKYEDKLTFGTSGHHRNTALQFVVECATSINCHEFQDSKKGSEDVFDFLWSVDFLPTSTPLNKVAIIEEALREVNFTRLVTQTCEPRTPKSPTSTKPETEEYLNLLTLLAAGGVFLFEIDDNYVKTKTFVIRMVSRIVRQILEDMGDKVNADSEL